MKASLLLVTLALAIGAGAACSSTDSADEEGDESNLTDARSITLGTCKLDKVPADRSGLMPPYAASDPMHFAKATPSVDQVLTKADLKMKIGTQGKTRRVTAITATIKRGSATGTVTFAPGTTVAAAKVDNAAHRMYEYRNIDSDELAKAGSSMKLGTKSQDIDVISLHWESDGRKWFVLGTKGAESKLVAVAPNCTFDTKAWRLLAEVDCENELFPEGGTKGDAGKTACTTSPVEADGGAFPEGGVIDPDTGNADAGSDAGAKDAGAKTDASSTSGPADEIPDSPSDESDGEELGASDPEESSSNGASGAKKKSGADSGGCTLTHGAGAAGWFPLAFVLPVALIARRRRIREARRQSTLE